MKIPFFQPDHHVLYESAEQQKAVVLTGNIGPGKYVEKCEEFLANYFGAEDCVCTVSGTTALQLAADVLSVRIVAVPAIAAPAVWNGFKTPQFIDITGRGFIDLSYLADVITGKKVFRSVLEAICYVHQAGSLDTFLKPYIGQVTKPNKIRFIQDMGCAIGWPGQFVGDLGVVSFSVPKLVTCGQGGAVFGSRRHCNWIRRRINNGLSWDRVVAQGTNLRMDDMRASFLLKQLELLEHKIKPKYAERFLQLSNEIDIYRPLSSGVPLHFIVFVDTVIAQDALLHFLRSRGIDARISYSTFLDHKFYAERNHSNLSYSNAKRWQDCSVYLPFGPGIGIVEVDTIIQAIKDSGVETQGTMEI